MNRFFSDKLALFICYLFRLYKKHVKGNTQFIKNTLRKNDSSTLKNVLQNTNEHKCNYLRHFTFLICLHGTIASFWGMIRGTFLAWMFFNAHNKEIATKLVENIGREYPAGQPFHNAYTALVWLYLTFVLFYLVYDSCLN